MSLVGSLIGAIPLEEGAALVARVGERATITAKSGSIEVGSVALTVEAMDDLIGQVLPPEQLESLQENGTVHFEFTPAAIGGDFAVLAASTPGDRWLEIRRRSTATTPAAAPSTPPTDSVRAAAPTLRSVAASTGADEAEVAKLLSRFQAPETMSAASTPAPRVAPPKQVAAAAPVVPAPPVTVSEPAIAQTVNPDFDLSTKLPLKNPSPEPAPAPASAPVAEASGTNEDLDIPANLGFLAPNPDFDLDGLTLSDTLPDGASIATSGAQTPLAQIDDSDQLQTPEREMPRMGKFSGNTSVGPASSSRRVVALAAVLGCVAVLGAAYWFLAPRVFAPQPVAAAAPPPAPRPPVRPAAAPAQKKDAPSTPNAPAQVAKASAAPAVSKATPPPAAARAIAPPAPAQHVEDTPRSGFSVQVAAVRERDEADRIVARLVNQGFSGYFVRGEGAAAAFYRVRVGAFKDRGAAEEAAARLARAEGIKPWIVRETP